MHDMFEAFYPSPEEYCPEQSYSGDQGKGKTKAGDSPDGSPRSPLLPGEASLAVRFAKELCAALGERKMSTAALQHYFVSQRKATAEEAIANVGLVVEAIDERMLEEAASKEEKEDDPKGGAKGGAKGGKGKAAKKKSGGQGGNSPGQQIHVHIHTDEPAASQTKKLEAEEPEADEPEADELFGEKEEE